MENINCLLLAVILLLALLSLNSPTHFAENTVRKYSLTAVLYPQNFTLDVSLDFHYTNDKRVSFTKLYFHFYPNSAYFRDYGGRLVKISVSSRGKPLNFKFKNYDGSVLEVDLARKLEYLESVELHIEYQVVIPKMRGRYGYCNGVFAFGNWYPILAVYDKRGWNLYPYVAYGESFYSEVASYDVTILVPKSYVVAATGELVEKYISDDYAIYHWKVDLARDFAWTASESYVVKNATLDLNGREVKVSAYVLEVDFEDYEDEILTFASKALKIYSNLFGEYSYSYFRLCQVFGDFAGMEYPALVMISDNALSSREFLEVVIAHETAHQWWYNVVGNDQASEPWLDEALAEYSQILYFEYAYGPESFREIYKKYVLEPYYSNFLERFSPPISSIWNFSEEREYVVMVYLRGAATLHMLRFLIGDDNFFYGLRVYYSRFYFKTAKIEDLISVFEEISGLELDWFFEQWLEKSETPGLELVYARAYWKNGVYSLHLHIRQLNTTQPYRLFVPITVTTTAGRVEKVIELQNFEEEVTLNIEEKPIAVELDPLDDVLGRDYKSFRKVEFAAPININESIIAVFLLCITALFILVRKSALRRVVENHAS